MKNFTSKMTRALAAEKKHFSFLLVALSCIINVHSVKAEDDTQYNEGWIGVYTGRYEFQYIKDEGGCYVRYSKTVGTKNIMGDLDIPAYVTMRHYRFKLGSIPTKAETEGWLEEVPVIRVGVVKGKSGVKGAESPGVKAFNGITNAIRVTFPHTMREVIGSAFKNSTGLQSIKLNEGLVTLGTEAFSGCTNLSSINIPKTLKDIPERCFYNCSGLPAIHFTNTDAVGTSAFEGCTSLVSINGGNVLCPLKTIGERAFYGCTQLQVIKFSPSKLINIGESAFENCDHLTNLTLPASLIGIGNFAFKNTNIRTLTNNSTTPQTIKANVFEGVDLSKAVLYVPKGCKDAYKKADVWKNFGNILEPGEQPVDNVSEEETPEEEQVQSVATGLQKIGDLTYELHEDLTATIVKDDNNKELDGARAFPASVKYSGYTYTVTAMSDGAFADCSKMTSITLPSTISEIPSRAFYACKGLKTAILPTSLEKIGESAFNGCAALQNCNLPATLNEIGVYAFHDCKALISVSIPAGVETIPVGCFENCQKLNYVRLPEGVTTIKEFAFSQCIALTTITLPASLTSVEEDAFSGAQLLNYVYPLSETPPTAEEKAFRNIPSTCVLYVPANSLSDYQTATGWKEFKDIRAKGVNEKVKYGKLYYRLSEDGTAVVTYESNDTENYSKLSGEVSVAKTVDYKGMEYTVQGVSLYAFRHATGITKVNLPNAIKRIEGKAFYNCSNLEQINIPSYMEELADDAFKGTKLYNNNIDKDGAVYYDGCLLAMTKSVEGEYKVKEGTRLIANWAITGQEGLTSLVLPEGLLCLCKEAVNDLENLTTLTLPSTLAHFGSAILNNCGSLTDIYNYAEEPYDLVGVDVFEGLDKSNCTLYVPKGSKEAYSKEVYWSAFPIMEMAPEVFYVTFLDWDGKEFGTQEVEKGKDAKDKYNPWRIGYVFTEWDKSFENVQSDMTVTALYEKQKFLVSFVDWDAHHLGEQYVEFGESAIAPDDPERDGYTFIGWDTDFSIVNQQLYITALYEEKLWTVTYLNWDDELLGVEEVKDGEDAKGMVATKVGWYFDYWYNTKNFEEVDLKNITKDLTVKAQFTYEVTFTVTYRVEGVTTFEIEAVYGFDVSKIYYNPTEYPKIPQKASDDMYDYTFVGWTPEVEYLLNNVVLEAVFEPSLRKFDVTFYDWDDTKLDAQIVEYGKGAEAPTPTRKGYTFTGWDQDFDYVTMDMDVKAQYTINSYSVSFVDWNGTVLGTQTVEYGSAATPPSDPIRTGYTFTGWDVEYKNVTSDLTVKATYEINKYTVRFFGQDGKTQIGENQTINWNEAATAPAEKDIPAVEGYHFTGWDAEFDHVKADLDIKAVYEINKYTVTFIDWDEKVLKSESVEHGSAATAPEDPTRADYNFTGWDKKFDNITADLTVQAQYELAVVYFTVTYYDWDLTVLGTEKVEEGKDAKGLDPDPTRPGYTFTGWSKPLENITSDLSVQAQYEVAKVYFTVTYYDWDLTILGTEQVEEGKDAQGLNPEPTREGYTFTGWSKPLTNITSDLSVQAQYEEIVEVDYTPKNLKAVLTPQENDDVLITLSWDKVEGAASYELRVTANGNELFSQNTMTLNVIASKLSDIEKDYKLIPGTYTINWFVRSTDVMGTAVSDWAQGESFEVTVKDTGTGVDNVQSDNVQSTKVMENGVLYIMYNGTKYNVQGKMVK